MLSDTSLPRLARSRPVLFALYESLLTGGCALFWYAVAGLLYLGNVAHDPWDPGYSPRGSSSSSLVRPRSPCRSPGC